VERPWTDFPPQSTSAPFPRADFRGKSGLRHMEVCFRSTAVHGGVLSADGSATAVRTFPVVGGGDRTFVGVQALACLEDLLKHGLEQDGDRNVAAP
jgi:hypothetical protein